MKKMLLVLLSLLCLCGCTSNPSEPVKKNYSSYQEILEEIDNKTNEYCEKFEQGRNEILAKIEQGYDGFDDWYEMVPKYYESVNNDIENMHSYLVNISILYYKMIVSSNDIQDYSKWNRALNKFYDAFDDSLDDIYDCFDDCFDEIYDELDELLDDAYDDNVIAYKVYNTYWTKMYRDYSDYWSKCYRTQSDSWSDLYRNNNDIWSGFYNDNFDVEKILEIQK